MSSILRNELANHRCVEISSKLKSGTNFLNIAYAMQGPRVTQGRWLQIEIVEGYPKLAKVKTKRSGKQPLWILFDKARVVGLGLPPYQ